MAQVDLGCACHNPRPFLGKNMTTPITPLITQTLTQITTNVLQTLIADQVKNPYLKATLEPVINTFIVGVLQNLDPDTIGRKTLGQFDPNSFDPLTGKILPTTSQSNLTQAKELTSAYLEWLNSNHIESSTSST